MAVLIFIAFLAFSLLIIGGALAAAQDIDDDPYFSEEDYDDEPCEGECPDRDGRDGTCSICGYFSDPASKEPNVQS